MIFDEIGIQYFKSFNKEQVFSLGQHGPHFGFISGDNQVDPKLGGNGAGKSTFTDALCWAFFGKTTRKLKAGDIKPWTAKGLTKVWVTFDVGACAYKLTRTQSPNKLLLQKDQEDEKLVEQQDVEDLIRLNFKSFLYSIVFSQFEPMFFDLGSAEKSEIFANIVGADEWLTHSQNAKIKSDSLSTKLHSLEIKLADRNSKVDQLEETSYLDDIENWDASRESSIEALEESIASLESEIASTEKALTSLKRSRKRENSGIDKFEKELSSLKKDILENSKRSDLVAQGRATATAELGVVSKALRNLDGLGATCTSCMQPIDKSHIEKEIDKLDSEEARLDAELTKLDEEYGALKAKGTALRKKEAVLTDEITSMKVEEGRVETKIKSLEDALDRLDSRIEDNEKRIDVKKAQENPYREKEEALAKQIDDGIAEINKLEEDKEVLLKDLSAHQYWVKGFKDVRLYVISHALKEFELEVNDCLGSLGLQGWKITFEVDKETKSKTIQKGFHVLIHSPSNKEPVKWESWSGGESQRLRLAGTIGLANLILTRAGIAPNIEFWDEPTQHLTAGGVSDLLDILFERSRRLSKTVWLVDHKGFDYGSFDSSLLITKTADGSLLKNG